MYVRDARNRDEAWLLDHIEAMNLDETAFRSRDYVIAVDEESNARAGFGRVRVHTTDEGEVCELTSIGVLDGWRDQGVGAHVVERLVDGAATDGFDVVYALTSSRSTTWAPTPWSRQPSRTPILVSSQTSPASVVWTRTRPNPARALDSSSTAMT